MDLERLIDEICSDEIFEDMYDDDLSDLNLDSLRNSVNIDGYKYEIDVSIAKYVDGAMIGTFRLINNPNQPQFRDFDDDIKKYLKAKEDAEMGDVKLGVKTGRRVLRKVMSFFFRYIKDNRPKIFIIHARDDVRSSHYMKLGNDLAKRVGYSIIHKKDPSTGITEFWLYNPSYKIDPSRLTESIKQYRFYQNYI